MVLFEVLSLLLAAILFGLAVAVPVINLLYRFNITRRLDVDFSAVIDSRKSKEGTPVMGGLIIVATVLVLSMLVNLNETTAIPLLVFAISATLGGLDDVLNIYGIPRRVRPISRVNKLIRVHANYLTRVWLVITYPWSLYKAFFFMLGSNPGKGIHAHEKILINSIAGVLVYFWLAVPGIDYSTLLFPLGLSLDIGWLLLPFVVLTVLTMSNAVNIADGLDGLSAGMLVPAFTAFLGISLLEGNSAMAALSATALGGTIAYLYFNIPPARIQMGDVGSLALGTLLAVIALDLRLSFLLLIICFPFILEFGSSLIQGITRRIFARRLLRMAPLHHHFELGGWSEEKTVMRFWVLAWISAFVGVWVYLLY